MAELTSPEPVDLTNSQLTLQRTHNLFLQSNPANSEMADISTDDGNSDHSDNRRNRARRASNYSACAEEAYVHVNDLLIYAADNDLLSDDETDDVSVYTYS